MIRFLFKFVFLLILLFVALAVFVPPSSEKPDGTADGYSTMDTMGAIRDTMMDLGNFCDRNPQACQTGKSVISFLGVKARDGARFAYEFLDSKFGGRQERQTTPIPDGTEP